MFFYVPLVPKGSSSCQCPVIENCALFSSHAWTRNVPSLLILQPVANPHLMCKHMCCCTTECPWCFCLALAQSCTSSHKKQQKTCANNEWCVGRKVLEILLRWSTWLRVRGGAARHSWNTSLVKFISFKNCMVPDGTTYLKFWALKDVKNLGW
jgi:hypothetical protein